MGKCVQFEYCRDKFETSVQSEFALNITISQQIVSLMLTGFMGIYNQ